MTEEPCYATRNGERYPKKIEGNRKKMGLDVIPNQASYIAIHELNEEKHYPVSSLCRLLKVSKSAYYNWLSRKTPENEAFNQELAEIITEINQKDETKGYRRINDELARCYNIVVNDKRILRILIDPVHAYSDMKSF